MRNILVGADDQNTALLPINSAHGKDILRVLQVSTEHLFVIYQPIPAFSGQQQFRHFRNHQVTVVLLEHGALINHSVNVLTSGREFADW